MISLFLKIISNKLFPSHCHVNLSHQHLKFSSSMKGSEFYFDIAIALTVLELPSWLKSWMILDEQQPILWRQQIDNLFQVRASVYYCVILKGVTVPNTFMNKKVNAIRFVTKHVPSYANIALLDRLRIILFGLIAMNAFFYYALIL